MREVLVIAGEASGDLHGAGLVHALQAARPDLRFAGIGGQRMREAGVEIIEEAERLAVMGFVEVLTKIPHHYRLLGQLERRLASGSVGLLVTIDYPGFNMKVAAAARRHGVPVLYYITPQVWAWGAGRLPKLAKLITKAATILPFEAPLLVRHGIDATFVGHPLLDHANHLPSREEARTALGLPWDVPVLALFPGSRQQEIERHIAAFVATAQELERQRPGLRVLVSVASTVRLNAADCPYPMVSNASFTVLRPSNGITIGMWIDLLEASTANQATIAGRNVLRIA